MSPFLRFFQKGEIKKPNGQYVSLTKIIPPTKPLPALKPLPKPVIDPRVKQFFEKDVKRFFETDVKDIARDAGDTLKNMLTAPKKLTDLFSNIATNLNSPILLPALLVIGAIVVVQVIKK